MRDHVRIRFEFKLMGESELHGTKLRFRISVSIMGRIRGLSFLGSFRVRAGFWLGPGTRLDPLHVRL